MSDLNTPDVATLSARQKVTQLARPKCRPVEPYSPTRYPWTYATDHVRSRGHAFTRANASRYIRELAERAQLPEQHVATQLAEAYIVEHNIDMSHLRTS